MTPEEKSLLERTYKLAEENNSLLHSMRRSARLANIMRIAYWAVIILASVGAYYAIQPYLNFLVGSLQSIGGLTGNVESANAAVQSLKDFLK